MSNKNHRDRGLRSEATMIDDTNIRGFEEEQHLDEEESITTSEELNVENEELVEETPKLTFGVIFNCVTLNIRESADKDSESLCIAKSGTELMVDLAKSTDDWYHVYTPEGAEGFCMKKFVSLKQ